MICVYYDDTENDNEVFLLHAATITKEYMNGCHSLRQRVLVKSSLRYLSS